MKVIIVGPAYPYRGGIADTNQSFAQSFQELGHQALLYTFTLQYPSFLFPGKSQYSEDPAPKNLKIKRSINSINPLNWRKAAKELLKENADLIIFRYWTPIMAPAFGNIAKRLKGKVRCLALCDNVIPHERKFYDRFLTSFFTKHFDGFITFSEKVKGELLEFTQRPVMVRPHPVNFNLGEAVDKKEAKEKLGLQENTHYLLFFGLVRKYKGLDLLLDAMAENEIKTRNLQLIVAGEFYDNPEIYTQQIKKLGIEEKVIIHNKFIPTEDVKLYFSAADLITQTYHTASQSGITQMALNFHKSVLVTNVGGLSEIVHHNKDGYVVDKNPRAIAAAISDFYDNQREEVFTAELKDKKENFSWVNFSQEVINYSQEF